MATLSSIHYCHYSSNSHSLIPSSSSSINGQQFQRVNLSNPILKRILSAKLSLQAAQNNSYSDLILMQDGAAATLVNPVNNDTSLDTLKEGLLSSINSTEELKKVANFDINKDESTVSIIVVGASGDLAKKKIFPALFALYYEDCLPRHFTVFGYARSKMSDAELRHMGKFSPRILILKCFKFRKPELLETCTKRFGSNFLLSKKIGNSFPCNDYLRGYLANPEMQQKYIQEVYIGMVIGNLTNSIQELYEMGARKFAFLSMCPLGCLPVMRALNPKAEEGACFEAASSLALAHNNALKAILTSLEYLLKGFKYCNSNFYIWLHDRITNPSKYGFKDGVNACCGSGAYRGEFCGYINKILKDDEVTTKFFHIHRMKILTG